MALSKRTLKRNNYASKARHLLIIAAARRMDTAAEAYNSTFQQRMSGKHHPEQAFRDLIRLHGQQLYADYKKTRAAFFSLRRKYGVEFTARVLRNVNKKPSRIAVLREALDPKPDWVRKQICGTPRQFSGCAVLPETIDPLKVGEMTFKQAVTLFGRQLIKKLMESKRLSYRDAKQTVNDYDKNRAVLLAILHEAIEKQELKVIFTRHKELVAGQPFAVTKITDV